MLLIKTSLTINQFFNHTHVLLLLSNSVSIPQSDYDFCRSNRYPDTMLNLTFRTDPNKFHPNNKYCIHNAQI